MTAEFEEPPYICEWCTTEWQSASALIACEIRCGQDRGRE